MPRVPIKPRWKKGESGNPAGRKRKYVSTLKGLGYKLQEINDTIQALIGMDYDEVNNISKDKKGTMLEQIVAAALIQSHKKKSLYNIETLLNRVYGKPGDAKPPEQEKDGKAAVTAIDPIEAARQYAELMK